MLKSLLVLIATIAFVVSPLLTPNFGGFDPERYPVPQFNSPVQPAGWAFSIWGVIYLGLLMHAVMGFIRYKDNADWNRGRLALFVSLAIGAIWLSVALVSPVWATVLIWVMLIASLVSLYKARHAQPRWVAIWPVALYAGWLSAASFVSIGLLLGGYGILDGTTAAVVSLALATSFALVNQLRLRMWPYAVSVAWGFIGICFSNIGEHNVIAMLSVVAAVLLLGTAVFHVLKHSK